MADIGDKILSLKEKYDSFYLYEEEKIVNNIKSLTENFTQSRFLYSVKTNPAFPVLKIAAECGMGFDAASKGEVNLRCKRGAEPDMIYYSAPGKTEKDIKSAMGRCVIAADSINEIYLIERCAADLGTRADIAVRINPDFTMDSDQGTASKFGIDEEAFFGRVGDIKELPHINIIGLHVHSRSQELSARVLKKYYENMLALCSAASGALGQKLKFVNMGGGLGIPYSRRDEPLDVAALGKELDRLVRDFKRQAGDIQVFVETGRYVIGNAGVYAAKAVDKKVSHGKTFVILNNTLNGFLRPSIARLLEGITPNPPAAEPLYTKPGAFPISVLPGGREPRTVTLAGNLCTRTDVAAKDITLPGIEIGDMVVFGNAGSYRAVLSPMQFRSLDKPRQIMLYADGRTEEI